MRLASTKRERYERERALKAAKDYFCRIQAQISKCKRLVEKGDSQSWEDASSEMACMSFLVGRASDRISQEVYRRIAEEYGNES